MKFGPLAVDDAAGAILAHSHRLPGRVLKKGRVLSAADVAALTDAGVTTVTAAVLEHGDVGEDAAATAVGQAARGPGLGLSAAFTGRTNLYAEVAGLALVDTKRVDRLNRVKETVTLATVAPYEPVQPRQLVATIKVIPFAARQNVVERCAAIAGEAGPLLAIAPFRARPVGLVQTRLAGTKEAVLDKTTAVTQGRLATLGTAPAKELRCDHDVTALTAAIGALVEAGSEFVLINGASAIVDRRDVIPAAIEAAGGTVDHFGMPVDPGNLILVGRLGEMPVLGLPGCARSPKLNGFDWVLQRLFADLTVGPRDIMSLGVGGLLKEIPARPLPRAEAAPLTTEALDTAALDTAALDTAALDTAALGAEALGAAPESTLPRAPRIAALVLAAGQSRRMGRVNKLLAEIDGTPMVARVIDAVAASQATPIVVVTGHEAARVRTTLGKREVAMVHNPAYAEGLSTSLVAGLAALPADIDGVIVTLGDMPRVTPAHINRLIAAFNPTERRAICVPTWRDKRGNPVLWARRFFTEIAEVSGDVGAKHLIGAYDDLVSEVAMDDDGVLVDVDSPDALTALRDRRG